MGNAPVESMRRGQVPQALVAFGFHQTLMFQQFLLNVGISSFESNDRWLILAYEGAFSYSWRIRRNSEATRHHAKQDTCVLKVWMHPVQASSIWPRLICSAPLLKDKPSAWKSGKYLLDKGGLSKAR
jgi:hypothetical protein